MEYIRALFMIFIAEMGDKTQILALLFATKYSVKKVLLGVIIGSFLNHGFAVALGSYLSEIIPLQLLQIIAGIMFIIFALWSLKSNEEDIETKKDKKLNAIFTVAMAFFLGELGDKTQLTAITLAVDSNSPFVTLLGTVSGMLLVSSIGIFVGIKLGDKLSKGILRIISFFIFLLFGIIKLSVALPTKYINAQNIAIFAFTLGLVSFIIIKKNKLKSK